MRCSYCGSERGPFHLDHVVPRSRGGPDDPINLVNACRTCNLEKGKRLPSEWLTQVPYHVARIEQRVSSIVAKTARGGRRGEIVTSAPPRIACDACGRQLFPTLDGMHVAWWSERGHPGEQTKILAFEILCTGPDRCLMRRDSELTARHGLGVHLADVPIQWVFGRWAWLELQCLVRQYVWTPKQLFKLVATMRQLSKLSPEDEPTSELREDDDPEMVDD